MEGDDYDNDNSNNNNNSLIHSLGNFFLYKPQNSHSGISLAFHLLFIPYIYNSVPSATGLHDPSTYTAFPSLLMCNFCIYNDRFLMYFRILFHLITRNETRFLKLDISISILVFPL